MDCLAEGRRLPREEVLFPLFVLLLLEQSRVKVQPPLRHMAGFQGSGNRLLFPQGKNKPGPCPGNCGLDWTARDGKNTTCKLTHSHSRTLPSLVPLCTEILKSQLVLTLHIMSIVSKEKRFMELKHPREVPPRGR